MSKMRTINVTVTPHDTTPLTCTISGTDVHDGAIFVPASEDCRIIFDLAAGASRNFSSKPFCAQAQKCPPQGAPSQLPILGTPTATQFTVDAPRSTAGKRVFQYRLNFTGGRTFDPIIIRD